MLALFYSNGLVQEGGVGPRNDQLPFLIQWSQIPSHFVDICVAIETSSLPARLRPYLQLFTETLLESDVLLDDGSRLHAADAKGLRSKDLVSTYGLKSILIDLRVLLCLIYDLHTLSLSPPPPIQFETQKVLQAWYRRKFTSMRRIRASYCSDIPR